MKVGNKETFLYMCDDKLFKSPWQILRPSLEKERLRPGFVSTSPLSKIIRESCQIFISKLHVIRKYVTLLIYHLIMKTLSLIFFMIRKQNPRKKLN